MRVQVGTVVRLPQGLKYTFLKTSFFTSQFLPNSEFSLWNKTLPGASLNCAFIKDFGPLWREHIVDKSVFHSDARSNDMSTHKGTCCSAIASTTTSYKISSLVAAVPLSCDRLIWRRRREFFEGLPKFLVLLHWIKDYLSVVVTWSPPYQSVILLILHTRLMYITYIFKLYVAFLRNSHFSP